MARPKIAYRVNRLLLPVKGYYFFFNAAMASLQPYLVVYLKQQGLSASESGVLFGSMPFLSFLVQPLVGAAADRWLKHKAVLVTATVLTGLFHLLFLAVPPRTPAGNVLTSGARLTCFSHHVPRLSVCDDGAGVSSDCLELKNGSTNGFLSPGCVANKPGLKTEEQAPYFLSLADLLEAFAKGAVNSTSPQCRMACDVPFPFEHFYSEREVCFPVAPDASPSDTKPCVHTNIQHLHTEFNRQDSVGVTTNSSERRHDVNDVHCSTFTFTPFLLHNGSVQDAMCNNNDILECTVRCQRLTESGACESHSSTFDLTFGLLYVIYLAAFLTLGSVFPIMDAITYAMLGDQRHLYGRQRVWGTVGYLAVGVATSFGMYVMTNSGQNVDYDVLFYANAGFCGAAAFIACFFGTNINVRCGNMLKNMGSLLVLPKVIAFLVVMFNFGVAYSGVLFLFWFLKDLGAPPELFALSVVCSGGAMIPVMSLSGRLIKRFGCVPCVCVSVVVMSARMLAYSLLSNPWLVLVVEPLHGACFGLMLPAATAYTSVISPPGMAATMQGRGAGGLLTGWMFSAVGARVTYRVYAGSGVAVFVGYYLLHRLVFTERAPRPRPEDITLETK
ncbi:hypothetical protein BaRGS_00025837, partial [Batillaria attramentaria]